MIEGCYASQHGLASPGGSQESKMASRHENVPRLNELNLRKVSFRAPRRAQSTHDYQGQISLPVTPTLVVYVAADDEPKLERLSDSSSSTESNDGASEATSPTSTSSSTRDSAERHPRPRLGAPRRSYSVMDYEPIPDTHKPSTTLILETLPSELHMAIFDQLDPIDSTCLGLTNRHFYTIHRRMHGKVPLSARRSGPNELERAWYMSGRALQRSVSSNDTTAAATASKATNLKDLALLRVRGQALCRKCGIYRCELWKHLQPWMPEGFEYCAVREKFGPAAPQGAREDCYRKNPNNPSLCGRHRVRK